MDAQEMLSEAYSDLKLRYCKQKDIIAMLNIKIADMQGRLDTANKLKAEYQLSLQELQDLVDGNTVYRVQVDAMERDYVRLDRYNKVKKERDMYLDLYVKEREKHVIKPN